MYIHVLFNHLRLWNSRTSRIMPYVKDAHCWNGKWKVSNDICFTIYTENKKNVYFFQIWNTLSCTVTRKLSFNDVIMPVSSPLELKSNQFEARTDTIGLNRSCCSIFFSSLSALRGHSFCWSSSAGWLFALKTPKGSLLLLQLQKIIIRCI